MIWVNFKNYSKTFGANTFRLVKDCLEVSKETNVRIMPIVSSFYASQVVCENNYPIWVGHIDGFFEGRGTGFLSPLQAISAGVGGTLLNHSEHKISKGKIEKIIAYLKKKSWIEKWKNDHNINVSNFKTMICFRSFGQALWIKKISSQPDFVAYEPSELIGGEVSVSKAKPESIKNIVKLFGDRVVVGAGIQNRDDVKIALKLGAKGVLVSSAVVNSADPKKVITNLALGFK